MSGPFEARYPGVCTECDERFEAGTVIQLNSNGAAHEACPAPTPPVAREVCPRCFIEKSVNGSCACEEDR